MVQMHALDFLLRVRERGRAWPRGKAKASLEEHSSRLMEGATINRVASLVRYQYMDGSWS
jgi:hypothetical protein